MIKGIIAIVISTILVASLVIPTFKNASTAGWSTSEIALWGVLTLITIVGLMYGIGNVFGVL
jgi:hypothetical protein